MSYAFVSQHRKLDTPVLLSIYVMPIEPSQLKEFVAEVRMQESFQIAIVVLLVYDTIISLDKEVKFFWKPPRRPVDFVYFMNRYSGIFGAVAFLFYKSFAATIPLCNFAMWTRDIANWITIISIDYILMIRVLALYSQEKTLSTCLKTLLALEAAFKLGVFIYIDIMWHVVIGVLADISLCAVIGFTPWQLGMVDWLVPLIYGTLLMVLALYKAADYWRLSNGFKGFTLVRVLIEDQIVYFVLAIACSMFAILDFKLQPSNAYLAMVLNELGSPSFLSLLGSRMLFNLKEAGERGQNEGTSYRAPSATMSDMGFAEPVNPERQSGTETEHSESDQMA